MTEIGNRVPEALQDQFKGILDSNAIVPSLSHYVKYAKILSSLLVEILSNMSTAFLMPGEQEIFLRPLTTCIDSSIIPCKTEIDYSTNTHC
jgi:hypothetical protein